MRAILGSIERLIGPLQVGKRRTEAHWEVSIDHTCMRKTRGMVQTTASRKVIYVMAIKSKPQE
jgi:hypothetical protein